MRFILGVIVGALGYWAYEKGMLPIDALQSYASEMTSGGSTIVRPTPHEVTARPAEPIPS
jgi:hypothetical protein